MNTVLKELSELSPIVQQLAGIAKSDDNDLDDLNGIKAKVEYLEEKKSMCWIRNIQKLFHKRS